MTHNSPVNLSSYIFKFRQKDAIKVPIWRLSSALVKICQIPYVNFWKHKPVLLHSNFVSILNATKHNSSVLFLAKTLHTLVKSSPLKCKFLKLLSSQVKIRQIPYVNFESTSQFLFRFFIIL